MPLEKNDLTTELSKFTYGQDMYEIVTRKYCPETQHNVGRYVNVDKDTCVDTETGDVIEKHHAKTKHGSLRSVLKTMNKRRRRLLYAINPILSIGFCAFITLTFAKPVNSLELLDNELTKFIKALQYKYPNLKYCCFKEISYENNCRGINLYHIHCMFWFDDEMNEGARYNFKNYVYSKWKGGFVNDYQEVKTSEGLNKVLFYLSNYSGDSDKSRKKRETLKHFPVGYHIVKEVKGLKNPKPEMLENFVETSSPVSISSPKASCGCLKLATYIEKSDPHISKNNE